MFKKDNEEKRFISKLTQVIAPHKGIGLTAIEIIVDTTTGVNYLLSQTPYGGMTPLLDENGDVVIDK
ncbi:MAG: hypothetical protein BEN19_00835 [Epulopiscium sp. Nuni2H_MBin003]|nr:MAG: hypothetical protein BEN19_00835 [Epulopiscium sp. Nuni2H_MBin003]